MGRPHQPRTLQNPSLAPKINLTKRVRNQTRFPTPQKSLKTQYLLWILPIPNKRIRPPHPTNHHHTVERIHTTTTLYLAKLSNNHLFKLAPHQPVINNPQQHQSIHAIHSPVVDRSSSYAKTAHNPRRNKKKTMSKISIISPKFRRASI